MCLWPFAFKLLSILKNILALGKDGLTVCPGAFQSIAGLIAIFAIVAVHLPCLKVSIENVAILVELLARTMLSRVLQRPTVDLSAGVHDVARTSYIGGPKLGKLR